MKDIHSEIYNNIENFPPLPTTVTEVMSVVNDPESSAKDLMQAILTDQSLCATILKIANSVLYGRMKQVDTLEDAIVVLGFNEVQNIALSRSVIRSFDILFKDKKSILQEFWDHAFTTALASKTIAENFHLSSPGRLFICGLIHDIGKLAMLLILKEKYQISRWMTEFSTSDNLMAERETFSTDHAEVGSRLLKKWNFPESLITAVEYHHKPENPTRFLGLPIIVQLADALAYLCEKNEPENSIDIATEITELIPDIENLWKLHHLPWEKTRLELWCNWLSIEKDHGRSILSLLSY